MEGSIPTGQLSFMLYLSALSKPCPVAPPADQGQEKKLFVLIPEWIKNLTSDQMNLIEGWINPVPMSTITAAFFCC